MSDNVLMGMASAFCLVMAVLAAIQYWSMHRPLARALDAHRVAEGGAHLTMLKVLGRIDQNTTPRPAGQVKAVSREAIPVGTAVTWDPVSTNTRKVEDPAPKTATVAVDMKRYVTDENYHGGPVIGVPSPEASWPSEPMPVDSPPDHPYPVAAACQPGQTLDEWVKNIPLDGSPTTQPPVDRRLQNQIDQISTELVAMIELAGSTGGLIEALQANSDNLTAWVKTLGKAVDGHEKRLDIHGKDVGRFAMRLANLERSVKSRAELRAEKKMKQE